MDYLFYGRVTTSRKDNATTISLCIHCEKDEVLNVYELSPDASHRLIHKLMLTERGDKDLTVTFDVQDNRLSLFIISGQSNEVDIPFDATYAVYNGEIIALPENDVIRLEGATYIFPDGERKRL